MQDQTAILIVVGLAAVFFALWVYSSKQKRKFEDERRKRKQDLARLKKEARQKED
ncbi:hypothetical protein [Hellea balneolensis]|uniref:hypothetical protein n=1 Tax=Hellea balneolensis TaxID=287478 RepID=UPI0004002FA1|nr:hypothetical protein [Hellea balneolensis]